MKQHVREYKEHFIIVSLPSMNMRNGIMVKTKESIAYTDIVEGQQQYEYLEEYREVSLCRLKEGLYT